ncbi:MAG: ATP-dependent helicase/deoxyribonuclease subunit B, partial [Firmicutes bacterium]|nr:ATP-dependent helicase/deoxyribonuclease subunit B [Bacillota bacterium]
MNKIAIRYIVGRAGSGKSHRVLQEIDHCLQAGGEERLILLVPEQFTLEAERDLIQKLNLPGIMRVEVLSFTRLAQRVFNEVGGLTRTLLNEQGKNMVLRKMIDEVVRDLTIYKKAAAQAGFIPQISVLLSELKQQGILPVQLHGMEGGTTQPILEQKLHDIALIYEHFNGYLQGRYLDSEDYLNLFIEKIDYAQLLKNSRIWLDGFTTFSPQSLKIIEKLMLLAQDITVSLTLDVDTRARDAEIFSLSRYSWQKIQGMAQQYNLPQTTIHLEDRALFGGKDPALLHLEQEIYAYPGQSYSDLAPALEVFAAANQNSELEYAAARIVGLVRERGWRWRDLAVVCNDMAGYGSLIKRVFAEYGIPCFMDQKRDIMNNPLIKLILSSGEVIRRNYRYEDVFAFFKTGFSGLASDEIEQLENFVLRCGIQGQAWKQEFNFGSEPALAELNRWREDFIRPLQTLEEKMAGRQTITAFCRAHYEYLAAVGVQNRLEAWTEKMNSQGRYEIVRENTQLWNIVLDNFDQLVEILGDQEVNLKEYLRILETGLASLEVGIIPTTVDQVLVGSIQRSKSHDILGLLVLGVN